MVPARCSFSREERRMSASLMVMDKALIPNAQNAELKALLIKVRPAFVAQLEHAKQIRASMQKTAG
jgi:putative membrane protein